MSLNTEIDLFEGSKIRHIYDERAETWYFSVVDVVAILTESDYQTARKYWNKLAQRLRDEGATQSVTNCHQLKLKAADGKKYLTDVADTQTMLRLIQSIPSPKAEPIKQWLAKVGYERMKEAVDPELSINRARENWQRMGHSSQWIKTRLSGQDTRGKLTDYWAEHEIQEGKEYALLTNLIHQTWAEVSVKDHKKMKGLKDHNLRDHMSEAELIFTALAELSTRQIAERDKATGLKENAVAGIEGGRIAKQARISLEKRTGQKVITADNVLPQEKSKKLTNK